jgi:hypothetical protein
MLAAPSGAVAGGDGSTGGDRVESHLRLDADESGRLEAMSETVLRGKLSPQRTDQLLGSGGQDAEPLLGSGLGLFAAGALGPEPELLRIEEGRFLATSSAQIPDLTGSSARVGGFEISVEDDLAEVQANPRASSGVSWMVDLRLDDIGLGKVSPPPTGFHREGDEIRLEWDFDAGKAEALSVPLDPPGAVEFVARTFTGVLSALRSMAYVIVATLFIPVLFLLLRLWTVGEDEGLNRRLRRQSRALLGAVALALLALLARLLEEELRLELLEWAKAPRLAISLAPYLAALFAAGAIFAAGRPSARRRLTWGLTLAAAASLTLNAWLSDFGPVLVTSDSLLVFLTGTLTDVIVVFMVVEGLTRILVHWLQAEPRTPLGPAAVWKVEAFSGALTFILMTVTAVAYVRTSFNLIDDAGVLAPLVVSNAVFAALPLLPLVILPGAAVVLSGSRGASPFLVVSHGLWLLALVLYLFFVVTSRGSFAGFSSPFSLMLGALILAMLGVSRIYRLEGRDARLTNSKASPATPCGSPLISHRRELIDRALLIERMQRLRKIEHQKQAKSEEGAEAFRSYRHRLQELDGAETYLQTGRSTAGTPPSAADRELVELDLPEKPPVIYLALGLGPGVDWRENGGIAFRYGLRLAILPIAYVLLVLLRHDVGSVFDPTYGFELLPVLALLGSETALWLVAAYVFGCLFTWLPWGNGALKGFLLALPMIGGLGLLELCPLYAGPTDWIFRCVEVLAFLSVLGVAMDLRTVKGAGLRERDLADLYQLRSVRFGIVNLAPLLLAALGIYQQIRAGNPQGAVEHALKSVQHQFPGE